MSISRAKGLNARMKNVVNYRRLIYPVHDIWALKVHLNISYYRYPVASLWCGGRTVRYWYYSSVLFYSFWLYCYWDYVFVTNFVSIQKVLHFYINSLLNKHYATNPIIISVNPQKTVRSDFKGDLCQNQCKWILN